MATDLRLECEKKETEFLHLPASPICWYAHRKHSHPIRDTTVFLRRNIDIHGDVLRYRRLEYDLSPVIEKGKEKMDDVVTWIFPANEVEVTEHIIGRGAFGEVRVARWRSIPVACKRLHAAVESDTHAQEVMDGLNAEMQILSKLRHPNLVLFLGVCVATTDDVNHPHLTSLPTMILTELMPCSLYDILEVHKVPLNLAEILDISLDISYGLRYLHSHSPSIIHRDISAKNILIGGSRAKIADLGQAKIFGTSALSRQTSMPGAMVRLILT